MRWAIEPPQIARLRKRYRELFRQEIADTVADPAEVEAELRFSGSGADEEVAAACNLLFSIPYS